MISRQVGVGVGVTFCSMTIVNAIFAASRAAELPGVAAPAQGYLVMVAFLAGIFSLMHLFTWFVYTALTGIMCRWCFPNRDEPVPFKTLFAAVGLAQVPLIVWAVFVFAAWLMWSPSTNAPLDTMLRVLDGTRYVAYGCSLLLVTAWIISEYRSSKVMAFAATGVPLLILLVASTIINVALLGTFG